MSAAVVLCLTGFTTGRGHGHGHHGGGGGCGSSGQDHDSSSSSSGGGAYKDDDQDDSYGGSGSYRNRYDDTDDGHGSDGSGSGSGTSEPDLENATVGLLSCATGKTPYATVGITNPNNREAGFQARVTSYDDSGTLLPKDSAAETSVPANGKAAARVSLGRRCLFTVDHCRADRQAGAGP